MNILVILLIILLICGAGTFPVWPHSANWGYGPSGGIGFLLIIVLLILFLR